MREGMKIDPIAELLLLLETMSQCMQEAINEEPQASKKWTPEELFEKGANWAARHILIVESESE